MTYILNEVEQRLAQFIASQRTTANRTAGVHNGRRGPQSDAATDLDGIGAELAFCHLFNVYPDLSIGPRRGGHDATWMGWKVDVKATRYTTGNLITLPSKSIDPCDLYALMIGTFPSFEFVGLATGADLFTATNVKNFGYGPTYALPQAALLKITATNGDGASRQ